MSKCFKVSENKLINRLVWVVLLLAIWEITAESSIFPPAIFPSLPMIAHTFYIAVINGEIINETLYSIQLISIGLFIGLAGAAVLSCFSMVSKIFSSLVETLTAIAHPLPGIALLPLIILWLGTGTRSIIFIIIHSVMWPMTLNMLAGFRSIPVIYKEVGQNLGLNTYRIIKDVMVPAALPFILSGVRIGWARAWRALISAEMIFGAVGGKGGLGWYIFKQRVFMDTAGMFAGLAVIIAVGMLVEDVIFSRIENVTVKRWGMVK